MAVTSSAVNGPARIRRPSSISTTWLAGASRPDDLTIAELPDTLHPHEQALRPTLAPGARLGRYLLVELLGRGAFGTVCEALIELTPSEAWLIPSIGPDYGTLIAYRSASGMGIRLDFRVRLRFSSSE